LLVFPRAGGAPALAGVEGPRILVINIVAKFKGGGCLVLRNAFLYPTT
jgi:hypothetical protein